MELIGDPAGRPDPNLAANEHMYDKMSVMPVVETVSHCLQADADAGH